MFVKICGVTNADDARMVVEAGADAIGLNLIPASKRRVEEGAIDEVAEATGGRVMLVGVIADLPVDVMRGMHTTAPAIDVLQLHGGEPKEALAALGARAYKAVRIGDAGDAAAAAEWPGDLLLVDAKVTGALGGTGVTFDWHLVRDLCSKRRVLLAGGLTPANVATAIEIARPYGVDVASGVEVDGDPRRKDEAKVRAFIDAARRATTPAT